MTDDLLGSRDEVFGLLFRTYGHLTRDDLERGMRLAGDRWNVK